MRIRIAVPWLGAWVVAAASAWGGEPMASDRKPGSAEPADRSAPVPGFEQAPAPVLRVLSFNIRYGTADDGENSWPGRSQAVIDTLRSHGADVVGVQEALRFQLDEIAAGVPWLGEIGCGRDDAAEAGEYSAILYDRRRLEAVDHGTFWLSPTPEVAGLLGWGAQLPRICRWARFRVRGDSSRCLFMYNTHWDHAAGEARLQSATLMRERILVRSYPHDPVVVTGDFNAGIRSPEIRALVAPGAPDLFDVLSAVDPSTADVGTAHGYTGRGGGTRIDMILASSGWDVFAAGIDRRSRDGRYPSDHFPVFAVLAMPGPVGE